MSPGAMDARLPGPRGASECHRSAMQTLPGRRRDFWRAGTKRRRTSSSSSVRLGIPTGRRLLPGAYRSGHRAEGRGTRLNAQSLHTAPKRTAYLEEPSGHGHTPAAIARSSSSIVSSMKSPRANSSSAWRSSFSSSACIIRSMLFLAAFGVAMPSTLSYRGGGVTKSADSSCSKSSAELSAKTARSRGVVAKLLRGVDSRRLHRLARQSKACTRSGKAQNGTSGRADFAVSRRSRLARSLHSTDRCSLDV